MYVTAHRIRTSTDEDGINAFYYEREVALEKLFELEENAGCLSRAIVNARPIGGNRIRSYLDVVAPDGLSWAEIEELLVKFVAAASHGPFPWAATEGPCWFRIELEQSLAAEWAREIASLFEACMLVSRRSG